MPVPLPSASLSARDTSRESNASRKGSNKINSVTPRRTPSPRRTPRPASLPSLSPRTFAGPAGIPQPFHGNGSLEHETARLFSSSAQMVDDAPQDDVIRRFCDTLSATLRPEMVRLIREGIGQLEAQQAYLLDQQSIFMKVIVEHIQAITDSMSSEADKMAMEASNQEGGGAVDEMIVQQTPSNAAQSGYLKQSDQQPLEAERNMSGITRGASNNMAYSSTFMIETMDKVEDADTDVEELVLDEEVHKHTLAVIRHIPNARLRKFAMKMMLVAAAWKEPPRTGMLFDITESKCFFALSLFFILCDQFITVAATNYHAQDADEPSYFQIAEKVFLAWFIFELSAKLAVHRIFTFVGGEHWKMHVFDLFLVILGLVEFSGFRLGFLRAIRLFKVAKVVRIWKALATVRDLRIMLDCLIGSWFAMFWAVILVGFLTYMFALVFVQFMTQYRLNNAGSIDSSIEKEIRQKFGSVQQGILTLFMSITGGYEWVEIYDLVRLSGWRGTTVIIFYVILFTVSVWNIVGSVFVEKVMKSAEPHPHEIFMARRLQAQVDATEMRAFFAEFDVNGGKLFQEHEWINMIEHGGMSEFLTSREVDLKDQGDARAFFALAREDYCRNNPEFVAAHGIPPSALVSEFLRVKGPASSLDIAIMQHNITVRQNKILKGAGQVCETLAEDEIL